MKRFFIIILFMVMSLSALLFGISCSNQTPNTAFVSPAQTIAANNPAWTSTPTPTYTPTSTFTTTPVPYSTPISGFNGPYALAIDPRNNNIYVGDTGNNLIKQYFNSASVSAGTPNGGIQNTNWPTGKSKGSNGLSFPSPKAIAVDSSGYLYVVSGGNNGVSKLDPNGNFIVQYSTSSPAMNGPLGVAVNSATSTLYVSDSGTTVVGSARILAVSLPGGVFTPFEASLPYVPQGLAIGNGNLFVAGNDNNVHIYALSSGSPASPVSIIPGFINPYAVALDSSFDVFVSDTGNHQIEEFGVNNYKNSPINIIGVGTLSSPEGIVLDSSSNVYVVDSTNSELYQFP